ncbi:MAG: hypothetical protein H0T89_18895 [Deltaproteobacteria bacterium]|nr:hypothetical protein [Deltaproteobacteria bacterium]MDQ3301317.1 hypothetical protein [Myxococcota bacterium]
MRALILASAILGSVGFGCGGNDDHAPYDTYQACFDEHTQEENLPIPQAIVVCCLDHPIAGMEQPVCGETKPDCINYLTANLSQTSAGVAVVDAACDDYILQKSM